MDQKKNADWHLKETNIFDVDSTEFKEKGETLQSKQQPSTIEQMEMALYNLSQLIMAANEKSAEALGADSKKNVLDNVFAVASVRDVIDGNKTVLHSQGIFVGHAKDIAKSIYKVVENREDLQNMVLDLAGMILEKTGIDLNFLIKKETAIREAAAAGSHMPDGMDSGEQLSWHIDQVHALIRERKNAQYDALIAAGKTKDEIIEDFELDNILIIGSRILSMEAVQANPDGSHKTELFAVMGGYEKHIQHSLTIAMHQDEDIRHTITHSARNQVIGKMNKHIFNQVMNIMEKKEQKPANDENDQPNEVKE